jgi:cell division ATPase FtsA
MGRKFDIMDEANKIATDMENAEKLKQSYGVATKAYRDNNEFYKQNKSAIINHSEVIKSYNEIINRFYYLSVIMFSVISIMILCKMFL